MATADPVAGTITGRRLIAGLKDTLVSSLHGGQGVGVLGQINITNRNNVASSVNLAAAETLGEIVAAINNQATGVTAAINTARNGIVLTDTTGATASNLIVADGDPTTTATDLERSANAATTRKNSGSLDRQQIGRLLGKEVAQGLINGMAIGLLAGVVALLMNHFVVSTPVSPALIGGAVFLAMALNLAAGGLAGVVMPLTLERLGIDPAVASAVFVTTVTDTMGALLFIGIFNLLSAALGLA